MAEWMTHVGKVNDALQARGDHALFRFFGVDGHERGYYFLNGEWKSSIIWVELVTDHTVEDWLAQYDGMFYARLQTRTFKKIMTN